MTTIACVAQAMQRVMGQQADALGRSSGFIQRERNLRGSQFVQTLVFGWWSKPEATLEDLAQTGASLGIRISPQGLDQRFTERAAQFLRAVLEAALGEVIQGPSSSVGLLARFSAVYVQDSTSVGLPDSLGQVWRGCGGRVATHTQASVKIQVQQDVRCGQLCQVWLSDGRAHDQQQLVAPAALQPGSLRMADVGYFNLAYFAALSPDHYWLSRLKAGTWVVDAQGQATKIETLLRQTHQPQLELSVQLGAQHRLPARLLAQRLPAPVAARRRQQARQAAKREGQRLSAACLVLLGWHVFVTNLPSTLVSFSEVFCLARVRWQIELLFKLWKSEGQLDTSRSTNPWRILCEFYAKLLGLLVQHWVLIVTLWHIPNRSLTKAVHTLRRFALALACAFASRSALTRLLLTIARCLLHGCRINKSMSKPPTWQLLLAQGLS